MSLDRAAESVVRALTLIDALGDFYAVEHAWMKGVKEDTQPEWQEWTNTVANRLDYLGYVIPELYEINIHLAHALRDVIRELRL